MGRRKTPEQAAWLEERYPRMPNARICEEYEDAFGVRLTVPGLASWASKRGLRKAARLEWTEEMDRFMREFAPGHGEGEIREAFGERFGITLTEGQIGSRKTKLGVRSGTHGGRYRKGHVPRNKGRTWEEQGIPEDARERMRATCYKPGNMPSNGADLPIGSESVRDGYVYVKVAERPSRPDCNDNWKAKHRIAWEEANGPVPDGCCLRFVDGDRANCSVGNLALVSLAENAVVNRSGMEVCDRESMEAARAVAGIRMKVSELRRKSGRKAAGKREGERS